MMNPESLKLQCISRGSFPLQSYVVYNHYAANHYNVIIEHSASITQFLSHRFVCLLFLLFPLQRGAQNFQADICSRILDSQRQAISSVWLSLCSFGFFLLFSLSPPPLLFLPMADLLQQTWVPGVEVVKGRLHFLVLGICDASCRPTTFQDTFYVLARKFSNTWKPLRPRKTRMVGPITQLLFHQIKLCSCRGIVYSYWSLQPSPLAPSVIPNTLKKN